MSERKYYDFYVSDLVNIDGYGYLFFSFPSASSTRAIVTNLCTNLSLILKFSQNFLKVQAINCWNNLPYNIVNAPSLSVFKHSYT